MSPMFTEDQYVINVTLNHRFNKESRKYQGHTIETAIKDLIDNHIDSGLKLNGNLTSNKIQMFIADDLLKPGQKVLITTDFGYGMSADNLTNMYCDNYSTKKHDPDTNPNNKLGYLGRFGNGHKKACAYLSDGVVTLSMQQDGQLHAIDYNRNNLNVQGANPELPFYRIIRGKNLKTDAYLQYWMEYMRDENGNFITHGTMNVLYDIDKEHLPKLIRCFKIDPHFNEKQFYYILGETYCKKINENLKIFIGSNYNNLSSVKPFDPFYDSKVVGEPKTFQMTQEVNGIKQTFPVKVTFHSFEQINNAHRPTGNSNGGFYIFREGRLHLDPHGKPIPLTLTASAIEFIENDPKLRSTRQDGEKKKSSDLIWPRTVGASGDFRCEIEYSAILDGKFNLDPNKTSIHLNESEVDFVVSLYRESRDITRSETKKRDEQSKLKYQLPSVMISEQAKLSEKNLSFYEDKGKEILDALVDDDVDVVKRALNAYNENVGIKVTF